MQKNDQPQCLSYKVLKVDNNIKLKKNFLIC